MEPDYVDDDDRDSPWRLRHPLELACSSPTIVC